MTLLNAVSVILSVAETDNASKVSVMNQAADPSVFLPSYCLSHSRLLL